MGRPTKYKPEYCKLILEFFGQDPVVGKEITPLPMFEKFAKSIGVCHDTILEWCKVHDEFSEAYKKAKEYQLYILVQNGLNGGYNTAFAIFTAKNILGWRDKVDHGVDVSGGLSITWES